VLLWGLAALAVMLALASASDPPSAAFALLAAGVLAAATHRLRAAPVAVALPIALLHAWTEPGRALFSWGDAMLSAPGLAHGFVVAARLCGAWWWALALGAVLPFAPLPHRWRHMPALFALARERWRMKRRRWRHWAAFVVEIDALAARQAELRWLRWPAPEQRRAPAAISRPQRMAALGALGLACIAWGIRHG